MISAFLTLFALVNFACTEVGTNNQVANGDMKMVEETSEKTDKTTKENANDKADNSATDSEKKDALPPIDQSSPDALIQSLYKAEDNDKSPFFQNENRALVDTFFTKDLAEMIWKDAVAATDNDVGALDFEPLYDSQDAEVSELKVGKPVVNGEKATVTVKFLNFGEEKSVKYTLAKENDKWKIEDINYAKETLKKILQQGKRTASDEEGLGGEEEEADGSDTDEN